MPKRWALGTRKAKFDTDMDLKSARACSFVRHRDWSNKEKNRLWQLICSCRSALDHSMMYSQEPLFAETARYAY
jgi:hypothetical protein